MCGIFGVIVSEHSKRSVSWQLKVAESFAVLSETRGKEAAGFAHFSPQKAHIEVYKSPVSAQEAIKSTTYKHYKKSLLEQNLKGGSIIGHTRLVTNGRQDLHENNQPVVTDHFVGIHNGIIVNDAALRQALPTPCVGELDTEALYRTLDQHPNNMVQNLRQLKGTYSLAFYHKELSALFLATNNGSLYTYANTDEGVFVFCSEKHILKTWCEKNGFSSTTHLISRIEAHEALVINISKALAHTLDEHTLLTQYTLGSTAACNTHCDTCKPSGAYQQQRINNHNATIPQHYHTAFAQAKTAIDRLQRCTTCLLPETMPFIHFNDAGECSMCQQHRPKLFMGTEALEKHIAPHRSKGNAPDCLVNFSGGRDSSYGLYYAVKELGLKPVTFTYDWGMITDLARRNIARICGELGVENIIISPDIPTKRANIRKNVEAWLKKPALGMVPLFMAGDKQYFTNSLKVQKQLGVDLNFIFGNYLEKTSFKTGFTGVKEMSFGANGKWRAYDISATRKLRIAGYYGTQFLKNPGYLNSSLLDTFDAFLSSYWSKHDFTRLFEYIPWEEDLIDETLAHEFDWERATDTNSTWRIGDGTASFYNYIYYVMAGFNENDTFLSNSIREGLITREEGVRRLKIANEPRYESIYWYCQTIGLDFLNVVHNVLNAPKRYSITA